MTTAKDILDFWFKEIDSKFWFKKDDSFDQTLRERFTTVHAQANRGETYSWRTTPEGRLAEIIVLDQFSRNMFRETPASFASDPISLVLAQEALAHGADKNLTPSQKAFMYMPYMHSESMMMHDIAVQLFDQPGLESNLNFEMKHKDIIKRFGRYPHRNKILNRESTVEEKEFLKTNPGF